VTYGCEGGADHQAVAAGSDESILREVTVGGEEFRMLTISTEFGAVQVARHRAEIDDALVGLRNGLIALGVLATAVAAVVGWFLAGRFTRPIVQLTKSAEHIAQTTDLSEPIAIQRSDEVGRLASSFNAMLDSLAGSRLQQQQLVMDASHELRTPLTTLRTNIELLARRPDLDEWLDRVAKDEPVTLTVSSVDLVHAARAEREANLDRVLRDR